jgi:hypothetical protein
VFGVIVPVGPGDREIARLQHLLAELASHEETHDLVLAIADDAPEPRRIDVDWPNVQVFRTRARQRGRPLDAYGAMVASTLEGLRICRERGVDMTVKLDTDAAVIGPFAHKIRAAFHDDPTLGVVGSYDVTSAGGRRDWTVWTAHLRHVDRPVRLVRAPRRPALLYKTRAERHAARRLVRAARAHAPEGAHCLGGAYAVSRAFLERAELEVDRWLGTGLGEDVVVGILCSSVGLNMRSLVGHDQPFALAWQGLPASPAELAQRNHSLVHSVKAPTLEDERRIRAELSRGVG